MLQTQAIAPGTLSVLKTLMEIPELHSFHLVGGTALALKYSHRTSIDLVHYPHPMIYPVELRDTIRIYDDRDLIAMKLQTILSRGQKKDFWDIAELMHFYDLSQMIDFHKAKYPNQMLLISIPQALVYFNDAEDSDEPVSLKGQTWRDVKEVIKDKVREFLS